jgi:pimeloyl-ACP methyl ester carboxylesterase
MILRRRMFLAGSTASIALGSAKTRPIVAAAVPASSARTKVLEIAYHESGNPNGFPVILLHGFPDDAHAYDEVSPALAKEGLRTFAVYLRGFGPTRFLDQATARMAQQAAIGQDVIDFADALSIKQFLVCGYDWGGRAACIAAALHPNRVRAAVLCGGYSIQNNIVMGEPGNPAGLKTAWYQWYFNTELGRRGLEKNRRQICKFLWQDWSPTWQFSDEVFNLTAASFDNPDFVDCVVHSYRHRTFNAPGENRFEAMERTLAQRPKITVPTIILHAGESGFGRRPPEITPQERTDFIKLVARRVIDGVGHFIPHEKAAPVTAAVLEALKATA